MGYSLGGPKELDTTEQLTLSHYIILTHGLLLYCLSSTEHWLGD